MLCPRCNSENEAGEKFCRHCGSPLTDTELFMSPQERKFRKKELKRQERLERKKQVKSYNINVAKSNKKNNVPRRTYSINEKAYQRNPLYLAGSLIKSVIVLIVIVLLVYFVGGFVLTKVAENTSNYGVAGIEVPSINYVLGDRTVKKVKYSYDKKLIVEYMFENVENPTDDLSKYIAYLMEHNKFTIDGQYDSSLENGTVKLKYVPESENADTVIADINWTTNGYSLTFYKDK